MNRIISVILFGYFLPISIAGVLMCIAIFSYGKIHFILITKEQQYKNYLSARESINKNAPIIKEELPFLALYNKILKDDPFTTTSSAMFLLEAPYKDNGLRLVSYRKSEASSTLYPLDSSQLLEIGWVGQFSDLQTLFLDLEYTCPNLSCESLVVSYTPPAPIEGQKRPYITVTQHEVSLKSEK